MHHPQREMTVTGEEALAAPTSKRFRTLARLASEVQTQRHSTARRQAGKLSAVTVLFVELKKF